MKIQFMKARIQTIAEQLRTLQTKIDIYSGMDRLAMEVHQTKYVALDMECLDLMTRVAELESIPDHTILEEYDGIHGIDNLGKV